jgi:hypothetical protein
MESAVAVRYQLALVSFSVPNQHRILQYLALLTARHYTAATLAFVYLLRPRALRRAQRRECIVPFGAVLCISPSRLLGVSPADTISNYAAYERV